MQGENQGYSKRVMLISCALALIVGGTVAALFWVPFRNYLFEPPLWQLASFSNPGNAERVQGKIGEAIQRVNAEILPEEKDRMLQAFHSVPIWKETKWHGVPAGSNPCDLWLIQQIIFEVRPDYVIETGTSTGGCALYYADVLENIPLESSRVITVDDAAQIEDASKHPLWQKRVEWIADSATDETTLANLKEKIQGKKVLVILNSGGDPSSVSEQLRLYSPLVSPGSYLVVQDTLAHGDASAGPIDAVADFLASEEGAEFAPDPNREIMFLGFNQGGWLKRRD